MVDRSKRKTLKIAAAASAMTIGSLPVVGSPLMSNKKTSDLVSPKPSWAQHRAQGSFTIQLITDGTTPEDSIIFINETGADITIKNFLPGIVTQNNQMIDLNSLLVNGDIVLKHGYPLATKAARWELLSLGPDHSYLWCDSAVAKLSGSDTGVITLNAVVNNGQVMLTVVHDDVVSS